MAGQQVGTTAVAPTRTQARLFGTAVGESLLGDVIADAQRAATDDEQGAVAAFLTTRAPGAGPSTAA